MSSAPRRRASACTRVANSAAGGEAGQVAGGVRVAHRPAVGVDLGLGEQAGQFDLAGAGSPVGGLAGAVGDRGAHHRHAGAVDGDVELVRRRAAVGGQHADLPARDGGRLSLEAGRGGGAVGLSGSFDTLGRQPDSGQIGQQVGGLGERDGRGGAGGHLAQPRRQRHPGDTKLVVAGRDPAPARGAVVVGAPQLDGPQHGVDRAGPVGDELAEMARTAVDPRATVSGVGGQQPAQQRSPEPGHRGADRQLDCLHAPAGRAQRSHGQLGQPAHLRRELRLELLVEPPFSACVPAAGGETGSALGGRASQMASFTATISSVTAANCW